MKYELFVFDLDGTLLNPDGSIAPATRDFLGKLRTWACITLATGRSLYSAWPYIEALGIRTPVVLYHGAVLFCPSTRKVLHEVRLTPNIARIALQKAKAFPVDIQVYRAWNDPRVYVESISPEIVQFAEKEKLPIQRVSNLRSMAEERPLKLLFIGETRMLEELRESLKGLEATIVRSERNYLEVLPQGVSKGAGLVRLCKILDVPLGRVVAVGDQESDVSMFECVGLGVAMAHAPCLVQRKAKMVIRDIQELRAYLCI